MQRTKDPLRTGLVLRNYRYERIAALLLPIAIACTEGNIIGVVIKKSFETGDQNLINLAVTIVSASTPVSNLMGLFWPKLMQGRDRVRFCNMLQLGLMLCVGLIALLALMGDELALMGTVACMLLSRVLMSGLVTARSDLWRANYPEEARARIAGRISMIAAVMISSTALMMGWAMETFGEKSFSVVSAFSILVGLAGTYMFSRIRWRGGVSQRKTETAAKKAAQNDPQGNATRVGPAALVGVLRDDPLYRKYMSAQFVLGLSNLASFPIFIIALEDVFAMPYDQSMILSQALPMLMPVLTIPIWARLFDGMHVIRFRAYHSWCFVLMLILLGLGFTAHSQTMIFISRIVFGIAMGGGMLAWNLGHHAFATRELANVYMGVHTTLTGIRGFTGPFLGFALYSGIRWLSPPAEKLTIHGTATNVLLMPTYGIGGYAFYVLACLCAIAALMFWRLERERQQAQETPTL